VTRFYPVLTCWTTRVALLSALVVLGGCGKKDGLSDNDRRMLGIANAAEDLKSKGAKIEERNYAQGNSWAVNLSGMQVNESLLKQVKSLGNISELNLSKSTLSDEHMAVVNELGLCTLCLKIDFSHTALSDAGFQKLKNLRFLSEMNLTGTKVSKSAVDTFKKQRENDPGTLPLFKNPTMVLN
jgi:hypothetical protein